MPKRTGVKSAYSPIVDELEIWKSVPGSPDLIASDQGRVASIVGHLNGNGYVTCHIYKPILGLPAARIGAKRTGYRTGVHNIVARTFLGAPKAGQTQVNHKDGDPQNNKVSNLEWCTPRENLLHAYRMGRKPNGPYKLKAEARQRVRDLYSTGDYSQRDLGTMFNVSYHTIAAAVKEIANAGM